tara:strand:- start:1458 stop:2948 length:1491 start_codon:yes stop_codon:yes gene_type:complete
MSFFISKTDYVQALDCEKNLWLQKHKPELFDDAVLSEFAERLREEGKLVDEASRNLFSDARFINARGQEAINQTDDAMSNRHQRTLLQPAFSHEIFFAQCDVLRILNWDTKECELFEVKASNQVKKEHIPDLSFQKIILEANGFNVSSVGVIHLNKEYIRQGDIDYDRLFITSDVTDEVTDIEPETLERMSYLKVYLNGQEPSGCSCIYKGRSGQCESFAYSNPHIPEYSIHDLIRIGQSKALIRDWIDNDVFTLDEIPNPGKLTTPRKLQYDSYISSSPIIDKRAVKETLDGLEFPLHFFDYEACSFAIPQFDGFKPYQFVTFQYSLHILHADGALEHKEYLITDPQKEVSLELVEQMAKDFYAEGSAIVWYKTFEEGRNKELAELYPDYQDFFDELNGKRIFDIRDIFSKNMYVDARSKGSTSLKEILPITIPDLTYKTLGIQGGTAAMTEWSKLVFSDLSAPEKEQTKIDLLEYCKLDSFAMVEIYRFLKSQS